MSQADSVLELRRASDKFRMTAHIADSGAFTMVDDSHPITHMADAERISVRLASSARGRYRVRAWARRPVALLPEIGEDDVILPTFEETLGSFAMRAQQGDRIARDALFRAYQPKLDRLMRAIRPPFAPDGAEGIWSREDVAQEAWLVFVDLVDAWAGDVDFTAFLLSRFSWRLKDVVLRGIGKPAVPPRWRAVPMQDAALVAMIETNEGKDALAKVLEGLTPPLAAVLVGHAIEGRTKAAIARELGVSTRTIVRYWAQIRQHAIDALARDES